MINYLDSDINHPSKVIGYLVQQQFLYDLPLLIGNRSNKPEAESLRHFYFENLSHLNYSFKSSKLHKGIYRLWQEALNDLTIEPIYVPKFKTKKKHRAHDFRCV
jgi:hypothetical protein